MDAQLGPAPPLLPYGTMSTPPVQLGDILAGKYRVERILGTGNMGVVVAATHLALGQLVALKFMLPSQSARKEPLERFVREARAAARLKSQHVTRVLDVGTLENGAPYMVMECLEGCDLAALLHTRGPLPLEEAVEYVLQACEAAGEAHAAGIVHRDLKPANLFLTTDTGGAPCIKVFDFGISKIAGDLTLTREEQALGSPLYMSPEQISSSKNVDGRSDLWALGAVLFELVTGQTPFDAETMAQLYVRVMHGQPTPLSQFRNDIPPGFEAVILQCLERDRERRFRNVADFAAALAPWASVRAAPYPERVARALGVHLAPAQSTAVRASSPSLPMMEQSSPAVPLLRLVEPSRPEVPSLTGSGGEIAMALAATQQAASSPSPRESRRVAALIAGTASFVALLVAFVFAFRMLKLANLATSEASAGFAVAASPAAVDIPVVFPEPSKSAPPAAVPAPSAAVPAPLASLPAPSASPPALSASAPKSAVPEAGRPGPKAFSPPQRPGIF